MLLLGCCILYGNKVNATIKLVAWIVQAALLDMVTKIQCCCKYQRLRYYIIASVCKYLDSCSCYATFSCLDTVLLLL